MTHGKGPWIVLASGLVACSARTAQDAFPFGPEALFRAAEVVALTPVTVTVDGAAIPESLLVLVDSAIESAMQSGGFATLPAHRYADAWSDILDGTGGLHDPFTGVRDEARFEAARQALWQRLADGWGVTALLFPEIALVDAPFAEGVARWDGTAQPVASFGSRLLDAVSKALDAIVGDTPTSTLPEGTVPAASLVIAIEDRDGQQRYVQWAGIEIVADASTGEPLPEDEVLRRGEPLVSAVERALAPLAAARAAEERR